MTLYSTAAVKSLDAHAEVVTDASSRVMLQMQPGYTARDCAARQHDADVIGQRLIASFVTGMCDLYDLGASMDCMPSTIDDLETSIRQLFEDARHDAWERTKEDAQGEFRERAA